MTVTFNEAAQTLSNRSGTIDLITELSVSTVTEEVTIPTGIYDEDGHEIIITLPIYEVDIIKTGNVTSSGSVVWEIIFNQTSRELHDVVITDKMPQGLAYSTSTGYLYDESTDEWIRTDGLYTYNSVNNTFTFNQTVDQPVRIVINSAVTDPTASSFKNTATINGSDFTEKPQKQRLPTMNNQNTNDLKATIQKRNEHLGKFPLHWTKIKPEFWIRPTREQILKKPCTFLFQKLW